MEKHLTRAFFEGELKGLAAAYGEEKGVEKVDIDLILKNGQSLRIEGEPVCTDDYITVDYKAGRAVLPYGVIIGVSFSTKNAGALGFHR